jgi:hypothetical protein
MARNGDPPDFLDCLGDVGLVTTPPELNVEGQSPDDALLRGFAADDMLAFNPGTVNATTSASVPWSPQPPGRSVGAAAATVWRFPGNVGGAVRITSDEPLMASQPVNYYNSFHETDALNFP